ncbi:hypothetical protein [Hymenobacter properus]|uniref:Uncharacterized protein n=1 Tax=Hymenobacter properus TaxID=2791026 RepID=A0A931FLV0_9BACT|nr:hypothetical protein [Hymenobacter properus]MBF9143265.1 hypothetical protein [Hymenobacter properus]MBR7722075.1 hypothetical protein [Microvirga sp. SRT04]
MNQAHIHLLVNHLPIAGSLFAAVLLGVGLLKRDASLSKAGLVAVLAAGLLCWPAQLSGDGAAAVVQGLSGTSPALVQAHATAAELAFWTLEATAALALFGLLLLKNASPKARLLAWATLGAALLSFGLLARAGSMGGLIRHTEIREGLDRPI